MTGQIVVRSPSPTSHHRRRPLLAGTPTLTPSPSPSPTPNQHRAGKSPSPNVGEVAGGTAAECFAVCCCCPCVLVEFVVLAVYKVPAIVCRRVLRRRRRRAVARRREKGGMAHQARLPHPSYYCDELSDVDFGGKELEAAVKVSIDGRECDEAVQLDKEMWERFHGAGFWRSPSQRLT